MAIYLKKLYPKIKVIGVQAERVFPLVKFIETGKFEPVD
jgi:threonine dehydratase